MKSLRKIIYISAIVAAMVAIFCVAAACGSDNVVSGPAEQSTVYFKLDDGKDYDSCTGNVGDDIKRNKPDPSRAGSEFVGWSLTPNGDIIELQTKFPKGGATYYAVFSKSYTVSLDAGDGVLEGTSRHKVKVGDDLYSKFLSIRPTAPGVSQFDGWYYNDQRLDVQSQVAMPESNITLVAKYSIAYSVKVFKQDDVKSENYSEDAVSSVTGNAIVGTPLARVLPQIEGYNLDAKKNEDIAGYVFNANAVSNCSAYYSIMMFNITFNPNAPSGKTASGTVESQSWGYNRQNSLPDCGYTIAGYRFAYWSKTKDGVTESGEPSRFEAKDEMQVTAATTFYAIWYKGLSCTSGSSRDYIYIATAASGTQTAILERQYADEYIGTYNKTTGLVTFTDSDGVTALSAIVHVESGYFTYLTTRTYQLHYFPSPTYPGTDGNEYYDFLGEVDDRITLTVCEDGSAVYTDNGTVTNGTFAYDAENSGLKFVSSAQGDNTTFFFRLSMYKDPNTNVETPMFEKRGDERGTIYCLGNDGEIDNDYYMELDGYGVAKMYAKSDDDTSSKSVTNSVAGNYWYNGEVGEYRQLAMRFAGSSRVDEFNCLLMSGDYGTQDNPIDRVYIRRQIRPIIYAVQSDGAAPDPNTADKFVLDGYGIFNDSAVRTVGGSVTKGRYLLDLSQYTLKFMPAAGDAVEYYVTSATYGTGSTAQDYNVYAAREQICGDYVISGLESNYADGSKYIFRIFNDGRASFYIWLPVKNTVYGNTNWEFFRAVGGTYELTAGSQDEYVFKVDWLVGNTIATTCYNEYNTNFGKPLSIASFGDFKFKIKSGETATAKGVAETTAIGDRNVDINFTYDGILYTTDGYGKAIGTDGSVKNYAKATIGYDYLVVTWKETENDAEVEKREMFFNVAGEYKRVVKRYDVDNSGKASLRIWVLDDGNLGIMSYVNSNSYYICYSYGTIAWESQYVLGTYTKTSADTANVFDRLYGATIKFSIIASTDTNSSADGKCYIYDKGIDIVSETTEGKITIDKSDNTKLVIDRCNGQAEYVKAVPPSTDGGETTYTTISGKLISYESYVMILPTTGTGVTLELQYDSAGKVIGYETVSGGVGLWLVDIDGTNETYLFLSGKKNETDNTKLDGRLITYVIATGEVSDADTIVGVYSRTNNTQYTEYEFSYDSGEVDSESNPIIVKDKYALTISGSVPVAIKYNPLVISNWFIYENNKIGSSISGGGYRGYSINGVSCQVEEYDAQAADWVDPYTDWVPPFTDAKLYRLTLGSAQFYFTRGTVSTQLGAINLAIMLDSAYSYNNYGLYDCIPKQLTLPATATAAAATITVVNIRFNGINKATLIDGAGAKHIVDYASLGSDTYRLYTAGADNKVVILAYVRIFNYTDDVDNAEIYFVAFQDEQVAHTYSGVGLSVLVLDGFNIAVYVDAFGNVYSGQYERVEGKENVVFFAYISKGHWYTLYIKVDYSDTQKMTFTILSESDPDYPTLQSQSE